MPEKVSLSRLIIKVTGLLSLFTSITLLLVVIYSYSALPQEREIRSLAGVDFLVSRALLLSVLFIIFGLLALKTASATVSKKRWAWWTSLLIGIILTLLVPLGTIFGIKLLLSIFSPEVKSWFGWPVAAASESIAQQKEARPGIDLKLLLTEEKEKEQKDEEES